MIGMCTSFLLQVYHLQTDVIVIARLFYAHSPETTWGIPSNPATSWSKIHEKHHMIVGGASGRCEGNTQGIPLRFGASS